MAKEILQKTVANKRQFVYSKGTVSLDFTLSVDNSSELRAFLSCLVEAQKDVENSINELKN